MSELRPPVDQAARDHITTTGLDDNLFVEAGAGAGKTTSLVGRVISLVLSGIDIKSIAAITFTEKAAAELRHRLRAELVERLAGDEFDERSRERANTALDQIDHAPIGTLHSFARRILNEFPIDARLPPGFSVLDEIESTIAFDDRWEQFLDGLLAEPHPDGGPAAGGIEFLSVCEIDNFSVIDRARGVPSSLRRLAADFHANWDLVEQQVDLQPPPPIRLDLGDIERFATLVEELQIPPDDKQEAKRVEVREAMGYLRSTGDLGEQLRGLIGLATTTKSAAGRCGSAANWKKIGGDVAECRDMYGRFTEAITAQLAAGRTYRDHLVGAVIGKWVLDGVDQRRREGTIEFHDLLVHARHLLSTRAPIRRILHERYQRVLLDEFQDTDPIQLAIAVRLSADPDDPDQDPDTGNWRKLKPLPGRLFIVGDPKQSIYRFRRADIGQYLQAAEQLGAEELALTANFRSTSAVIDWCNEVFGRVIVEDGTAQPPYQRLDVARPAPNGHGSVHLLGGEPLDTDMNTIREREAAEVVATVTTALADGWPVGDRDVDGGVRPCRPGDICILLPSRASLGQLESELRLANLPYRAENSSVVYETAEIRALMLALRAADDITDELALVAALRTPLFGVSDVELYRWRTAGGRWSIFATTPEGVTDDHPVAEAYRVLREVADRSTTNSPAELLSWLVDERRVLDTALDGVDTRDVWRRIRFVIEQARAWNDAGGHGLRRYLRWAARQAFESRSADTVLPETDHDAVRIMTVHAAKGLEFPITVLSGMSTKPQGARAWTALWTDDSWQLVNRDDEAFDELKPVDEQMSDAERRRLLYVACTRAVDHLVVSLHHKFYKTGKLANGQLLAATGAIGAAGATVLQPHRMPVAPPAPIAATVPIPRAEWAAELRAAFTAGRRRLSVSATALAARAIPASVPDAPALRDIDPGIDKEPVDIDLPPWKRGRYGTAIGRAVHAVLQYCDLDGGADLEHHAGAQCAAEGIFGFDATVAALARSAIGAPIIHDAIDVPHHRELFVASSLGDVVIEGYIDLFIETLGGGIIVDYKTDQWFDDDEREQRVAKYRVQLATYGVALEQILGTAPERAVLVRCRPDAVAEEIEIPDWPEALADARQQLVSDLPGVQA